MGPCFGSLTDNFVARALKDHDKCPDEDGDGVLIKVFIPSTVVPGMEDRIRALHRLPYHLLNSNCEHAARYVLYGAKDSFQINAVRRRIMCVVVAFLFPTLASLVMLRHSFRYDSCTATRLMKTRRRRKFVRFSQ